MPEQPIDRDRRDEAKLPVPAVDRRPVRAAENAVVRTFAVGPALAASLIGAVAAAAVTGAAVAARLLWPWTTTAVRDVAQPQPTTSSWFGPGVRVSYTHVEIYWPGER